MSAQGFWDDNERAAKISEEHSSAAKKINLFENLESRVSDIDELITFAADEGDEIPRLRLKKKSMNCPQCLVISRWNYYFLVNTIKIMPF